MKDNPFQSEMNDIDGYINFHDNTKGRISWGKKDFKGVEARVPSCYFGIRHEHFVTDAILTYDSIENTIRRYIMEKCRAESI